MLFGNLLHIIAKIEKSYNELLKEKCEKVEKEKGVQYSRLEGIKKRK